MPADPHEVERIVCESGNSKKDHLHGPRHAVRGNQSNAGKKSPTSGSFQGPAACRVGAHHLWNVHWEGGRRSGDIPQTRASGVVKMQK